MKRILFRIRELSSHPLIRNSAIMFAGTMGANVLGYGYHLVIGRILGPVGYGELAALISIFYIINAPSTVLQSILVKFFSQLKAKSDYGQAHQLFIVILKFLLIIGVVGLVFLIPFIRGLSAYLNIHEPLYLIWLYLTFATFLFSILIASILQSFQKFTMLVVLQNISGVTRLILGTAGAFFGVGLTLVLGVVSNVVNFAIGFIPIKTLLGHKTTKVTISAGSAFLYSVPTFIAIICMTAIYSQDVVLVKHFFNAETAGIYSSLSVLGKIIFFASSSIGLVAFPILAERKELGKAYDQIVMVSLGAVAMMSFGLTIGYYLFPSLVVNLLFGKAFLSASAYLGPFGLFISFYTLANLFVSMYLALGKTNVWIFAVIAAGLQMAVMNIAHTDLSLVIRNNTFIAGGLFILLLLYYPYARRKS